MGECSLSTQDLPYGISWGSILSPILLNVYTRVLCRIILRSGARCYQYVDDIHLSLSHLTWTPQWLSFPSARLQSGIAFRWITGSWIQTRQKWWEGEEGVGSGTPIIEEVQLPFLLRFSLGIFLDPLLHLDLQVARDSFHQLHLVRRLPFKFGFLSDIIIHAFITSRLNYCNTL